MSDKILFWISRELIHFGIAKYFQEIKKADLYAIIEIKDKPKKYFEQQNLVQFKKKWFFYDHVYSDKEAIDIDYLRNFEKKYKINLWLLAYSERYFYEYNQHYRFSRNEILSIIEQECKFFEQVLNEIKPDFLITKLTDFHNTHLLYCMCRSLGIKILMLKKTRFGNKWMISEKADHIDYQNKLYMKPKKQKSLQELQKYLNAYEPIRPIKRLLKENKLIAKKSFKSIFPLVFTKNQNNDRTRFLDKGRTRTKLITNTLSQMIKKKIRHSFINKNFINSITDEKFVFFTMHFEPERNLLIGAPFFKNQLEIITNLAKSLPIEYKLYVKEHPLMSTRNWRAISFYKKIMELPNVRLIHPSYNSKLLIEKCSLVAAIAGTSAFEAAFYDKPSIVFSEVSYADLTSVHTVYSYVDLPKVISDAINQKFSSKELSDFVTFLDENSFNFEPLDLMDENWPFYGNLSASTEISNEQMNNFLHKHKKSFKVLAEEHVEKIQEHKNMRT